MTGMTADPAGMQMPEIFQIAQQQQANQPTISRIQNMWAAASSDVLPGAAEKLKVAADNVGNGWRDDTYHTAFRNPIDKSYGDLLDGAARAAKPMEPLSQLYYSIQQSGARIQTLKEEWDKLQQTINARPIRSEAEAPLAHEQEQADAKRQADQLTQEARTQLGYISDAYQQAATSMQTALQGLRWNGPRSAAGSPTAGAPADPSSAPADQRNTSPQSPSDQQQQQQQGGGGDQQQQGGGGGQQGGGGDQQQQGGGDQQQDGGGQQAGAGGDDGATSPGAEPQPPGDTGLAGDTGTGTLPSYPSTQDPYTPPAGSADYTHPSGGGIGGAGGLGGAGAGAGAGGGAGGGVKQAAREFTQPAAPPGGQGAPTLAGTSTGNTSGATASTGMGGMPMSPPMHPPQGAGGAATAPKPGTAQPIGEGRMRPAGPTLGVPSGLRGRTGKADASRQQPASRRVLRDGSQTVELLDTEMWQVDPAAAAERQHERPVEYERRRAQ